MENYYIIQPEKESKKYIGWTAETGIYLVEEISKAKMFGDKLTLQQFAIENNIQFYDVNEIIISISYEKPSLFLKIQPLNHQPDIIFNDNNYYLDNDILPGFVKSLAFEDEFEATMVFGLWMQYTKNKKDGEISYDEFRWIMKMTFRMVNVKSNWAL